VLLACVEEARGVDHGLVVHAVRGLDIGRGCNVKHGFGCGERFGNAWLGIVDGGKVGDDIGARDAVDAEMIRPGRLQPAPDVAFGAEDDDGHIERPG
jgi:hypothetical protein